MAGARGPEPRKGINQRMDDLRKQPEIASTDVLFFHTLSGYQNWKPAKRHQTDLPKCMAPLDGPVTVYINRRGAAPSFQRDIGPVKSEAEKGDRPPAAQGLPPITSKVPYFGHYGGAPWQDNGKPHGALGYPKDQRKKTKCRKILGDFCTCFPQQGGGVLQQPENGGPYMHYFGGRSRVDTKDVKGSGYGSDAGDEKGPVLGSDEDKGADARKGYDRAKAEYRTEKDLDNAEKSWGILEQILKMENDKRLEAEEAARQQALYAAMWDEFDDVVETSDEEQTHICLHKTKCIPRHCKIWRVGSEIQTSSSSEEEPEVAPARTQGRGTEGTHHAHFTSVDEGGAQKGSTMPQTEDTEKFANEEPPAGSIRRSTFGTGQEDYPGPYGSRQESFPANEYYVERRTLEDFKRPSERRSRAVGGGVCYGPPGARPSEECKRKRICESTRPAPQIRKQKEKAPCSRKKFEEPLRSGRADPPSVCGRPGCKFSNRLTYPVETPPYNASDRQGSRNTEHAPYQQPTVSCPIKWRD